MFENIVESWTEKESIIIDDLFKSLKDGDYINRIVILNSDLSDFTKNYILYEFDEESTSEDLKLRISKANKLFFNYALRPKWTLQTFLFNNFESRPPTEILKKLNIFTFYNYYSDSIKDAIKDNFQIFITKTELTSIIDSVNLSIYEKLSKDINSIKIKNFLLQLFLIRYEKESEYNLESTIPFSFIKIFLDDKSYSDFADKFSVVKDLDSHTELSLKDIIKVLTDKYLITETPETKDAKETASATEASDDESEIVIIEEDKEEDRIEITDKEKIEPDPDINLIEDYDPKPEFVIKPLKEIRKDNSDLKEKTTDSKSTSFNKKDDTSKTVEKETAPENKTVKINDPLKKFRDKVNPEKKEPEKKGIDDTKKRIEPDNEKNIQRVEKNSISLLFDDKKSEKILKKVYKSDQLLMEMSFTKLEGCQTWEEASAQMKQVFRRNNVDLYNKDVVSFVDKLYEYFKNK